MARSGLSNIKPVAKPTKPAESAVRGRHGRNQPAVRDKRVGVSVNAAELQQLRFWAAENGISMADLLRQAAWVTLGNEEARSAFLASDI